MYAHKTFTTIRGFDATLQSQVVPSRLVIPQGGSKILVDGEKCTWTEQMANKFRKQLFVPTELEQRLDAELVPRVWQNVLAHEAALPLKRRRLPNELRLTRVGNEVIGYCNANLVSLSNSQVIEALEQGIRTLALDTAEVQLCGDLHADAWQIKILFPTVQVAPRAGDIVQGGLYVRFSAVNHFSLQVQNCLHRLWCENGATVPICTDGKRLRIRRRRDTQFADQDCIDRFRTLVEQGVAQLEGKLAAVKAMATGQTVDAKQTLRAIAVKNRLSNKITHALLAAFNQDEAGPVTGQATRYDIFNAVTRLGTHGVGGLPVPSDILNRLQTYSGVYSQSEIHTCPNCARILEPSRN